MFWIQETGTNKNNMNYRLIYAEFESDLDRLPTQTDPGNQDNGDTIANKLVSAGSECIVLETGDVYVLGKSTNTWDKFGGA